MLLDFSTKGAPFTSDLIVQEAPEDPMETLFNSSTVSLKVMSPYKLYLGKCAIRPHDIVK